MSKDSPNNIKPFYRPQNNVAPKPPPIGKVVPPNKHFNSDSTHRALTSSTPGADEFASVLLSSAVNPSSRLNDRPPLITALVDVQKLQDRITCCLALQAAVLPEWAISMRLRPDLAQQSRFRLESNRDGEISLTLFSELMPVVQAMQSHLPSIKTALAPWSRGTPKVAAELCESVLCF